MRVRVSGKKHGTIELFSLFLVARHPKSCTVSYMVVHPVTALGGIPPIPCYESPTDIDTYIHASHRSGRGSSYMLIGCINQCDGYLILSISTASSFFNTIRIRRAYIQGI
jgi:hypothetical protein